MHPRGATCLCQGTRQSGVPSPIIEFNPRHFKKRGVAQLVARLVWEDTPGQSHNFISGCCAVGSAPALGAGGPGFESPHSDQILQKNRLNRRFFCILSLIFVVLEIAVLRRFQWWNSGRGMSERSRRNRQIPNPSLTGKLPHFAVSIGPVVGYS